MSEMPSDRHRSHDESFGTFREARVTFDPSEQLNELLTSFLNDEAYMRLGADAIKLTLQHQPYRYNETDPKEYANVNSYDHDLRVATPRVLRVSEKWGYASDGGSEKRAQNLFVSMQIGGTALARVVAREPFYTLNLPLRAVAALPSKDLLPATELEKRRQEIERELHVHPGREGIYASPHYVVGNPRVATRPINPLRLVK